MPTSTPPPPNGFAGAVSRSSGSSITVGTGSKTFNIPSGGNDYDVGDLVVITSQTDATAWMSGAVTDLEQLGLGLQQSGRQRDRHLRPLARFRRGP